MAFGHSCVQLVHSGRLFLPISVIPIYPSCGFWEGSLGGEEGKLLDTKAKDGTYGTAPAVFDFKDRCMIYNLSRLNASTRRRQWHC